MLPVIAYDVLVLDGVRELLIDLIAERMAQDRAPLKLVLRGTLVGWSALSGFVAICHSYDYFSQGASFFKIPESFGNLT